MSSQAKSASIAETVAALVDTNNNAASRLQSDSIEFKEYVVRRDNDRPFSFSGVVLASATMKSGVGLGTIAARLYKTKGGKYVASLVKDDGGLGALVEAFNPEVAATNRNGYSKAQVFDVFEEAIAWFRPGRLTDQLRKQLGLDEPIRIE